MTPSRSHSRARDMQVYLVGDPAQLPATVMSERAVAHGYTRSMFQRLQAVGHPVKVSCRAVPLLLTCALTSDGPDKVA